MHIKAAISITLAEICGRHVANFNSKSTNTHQLLYLNHVWELSIEAYGRKIYAVKSFNVNSTAVFFFCDCLLCTSVESAAFRMPPAAGDVVIVGMKLKCFYFRHPTHFNLIVVEVLLLKWWIGIKIFNVCNL